MKQSVLYVWYKPGVHHALLSFIETTTVSGKSTTTSNYAYYDSPAVGIEDVEAENKIQTYPNPTSKILTIQLPINNKVQSIEVVDVLGRSNA